MSAPTLYYMAGSCALSCHVALEWTGIEYEAVRLEPDAVHADEYLAVNPKGRVPALSLPDGTVVTEALAILYWIRATHDETLVGRTPLERARTLEALSELTGEMHPAFAPLHVPERYADDDGAHESVRAAARRRVREHYDRWDRRLEGRPNALGGERRTVADAYLFAMCRWTAQIDASIGEWPNLARFVSAMRSDPGVRAALDAEGLD